MTAGNVMMVISGIALVAGTIGLIASMREKARQRKQEKHYVDMRKNI